MHSVSESAPADAFFLPCGPCTAKHGFDAVAFAAKQRRAARVVAEEVDEFAVLLPKRGQDEEKGMISSYEIYGVQETAVI